MMKCSLLALLFVLASITLLSSCGFHLRGPMTLAKPLQQIYIQTEDPYGELARHLKQYLKTSGVQLMNSPTTISTTLQLSQERSNQELLSINSSQQTLQYNLKLMVTFKLLDAKGKVILAPQTVTETRPLTLQSNQVLAGSNQAAQLYQNMRRSLVYMIMMRLASPEASKTLTEALATP